MLFSLWSNFVQKLVRLCPRRSLPTHREVLTGEQLRSRPLGLSQEQLAKRSGLCAKTIYRYECIRANPHKRLVPPAYRGGSRPCAPQMTRVAGQ
jgi:hypothetical protein